MSDILENVLCALLAVLGAFLIFMLGVGASHTQTYKTIQECEAELPRNQTCELVAVVKEDE